MRLTTFFLVLLPALVLSSGNNDCREVPKECDFIIVGAGAAGATLSGRLSEDPGITVCLFEAGRSDTEGPYTSLLSTPRLLANTGIAGVSWNTSTVAQEELNSRRVPNGMGKALGGSTTHNAMVYFRGIQSDFDYWAENGADGWDFKSVLPFFLKSENNTVPELQDSPLHSKCGPLTVTGSADVFETPLWKLLSSMTKEAGLPEGDCNAPSNFGLCRTQFTIKNGERASSSAAFLRPAMARKNLFVVTDALVGKILIKQRKAIGIRYLYKGRIRTAKARREVIVSGGTYESPKLLQLSGIGPIGLLKRLKIKPVIDLPVGNRYQQHVFFGIDVEVDVPTGTLAELTDSKNIAQYVFERKGPFAEVGITGHLFLDYVPQRLNWPELELEFMEGTQLQDEVFLSNDDVKAGRFFSKSRNTAQRNAFTLFTHLSHAKSRGTIKISSKDPLDLQLIDSKTFSHPEDIRTYIRGIREIQKLLRTPSMRKANAKLRTAGSNPIGSTQPIDECFDPIIFDSFEFWSCVLRRQAVLTHPVSSCPIGRRSDGKSVVDQLLRVHGIKRLRVVDASVMPEVTSANTMGPSIMIGERAAAFIKRDYMSKRY